MTGAVTPSVKESSPGASFLVVFILTAVLVALFVGGAPPRR